MIYSDEAEGKSNVEEIDIVRSDKPIKIYNLNVSIAVWYRVNLNNKWILISVNGFNLVAFKLHSHTTEKYLKVLKMKGFRKMQKWSMKPIN